MMLFEKDFIMRQVQYLTQLLQQIIFKKDQNQYQEAKEDIHNALEKLTLDQPKAFHELSLSETLTLFKNGNKFESELAIAAADLLVEEGELLHREAPSESQKIYSQALLLYKQSLQNDTAAIPLDISEKLNKLEELLPSSKTEKINRLLTS